MFCRFCGNELADNEKVCPVCANSVDESTEKVKKKIDKKKIIIICIAVALVFCITIAVIAIVNEHNRKEEYGTRVPTQFLILQQILSLATQEIDE